MAYHTKKYLKRELPDGFQKVDIKTVQKRLIPIMKELVDICNKHDIKIYPVWGSLLGYKRHNKKMIPGDDDIDLGISHGDMDKLKKILKERGDDRFKISSVELPGSFGSGFYDDDIKTITSNYFEKGTYSRYSIDIFELGRFDKERHEKKLKRLMGILFVYDSTGGGGQKVARSILKCLPRALYSSRLLRYKNKYLKVDGKYEAILADDSKGCGKTSYHNSKGDDSFEGIQLFIPNNVDDILEKIYGDGKKTPNKDEVMINGHTFGEEKK